GPVTTLITPPNLAFLNSLTTLSATITDVAPGLVSNAAGDVFFTVKQTGSNAFWDYQLSTFTVASANTNLNATKQSGSFNSGLWTYTTSYFQNGAAWVSGQQYTVTLVAKDKAGNNNAVTTQNFTYDISQPTATILNPQAGLNGLSGLTTLSGTAEDENAMA